MVVLGVEHNHVKLCTDSDEDFTYCFGGSSHAVVIVKDPSYISTVGTMRNKSSNSKQKSCIEKFPLTIQQQAFLQRGSLLA
jgi:hypothetical protein